MESAGRNVGQGRDKEFGSTKSIEVIVGLSTLPLVIPSAPFAFPNPEMVRRIGQGGYGEVWFAPMSELSAP